jgi:integrase
MARTSDYVIEFTGNRRGHDPKFRNQPVASVKKAVARLARGLGIEGFSPHILRHTAASHMVMAGVPLAEVARMLGDSEAMVEKTYAKFSPDYLRRAADALAGETGPRDHERKAR